MLSKSDIARLRGLARSKRDRRDAGRFVVEGHKLVGEVVASQLRVRQIVVVDDATGMDPGNRADGVMIVEVPPHQLARIASTSSPQPIIAEVELPSWSWDDIDLAAPLLVGIDINDPGNVGTLARSAEASGFAGLVLLGGCADPWAPKTVRASAGALFRLPVIEQPDPAIGLRDIAASGRRRIGTRMTDADPCDHADLTGPTAVVLGSEAHGLGADHESMIDSWVSIPMAGSTESLNVAMAGTILSYEVARQSRGEPARHPD